MRKKNIRKMLAAAGSFVVLANSFFLLTADAKVDLEGKEFFVSDRKECRRLLMEIVSSGNIGERNECFLTGKDYEPETLVIAQMFPDAVNISNTKMSEYEEDGHHYVTCRVGFERGSDEEQEKDQEVTEGDHENRRWSVGDIRTQRIGDQVYRFRCIDDDYGSDSAEERCALFLCETVIRSDVESIPEERKILPFGETNNYKTSQIRSWLKENSEINGVVSVNTGVNSAFLGATMPGTCHEFSESAFSRQELPVQSMTDGIFILSLEEAFQYKEELWNADGRESPYSRGYWLRTPAFAVGERGEFIYGSRVYAVDLEQGCIRMAEVDDGSIGIRPAFCLPQM